MTTWAQDDYCAHFTSEEKFLKTKIYSIICVICLLFSSSFVLLKVVLTKEEQEELKKQNDDMVAINTMMPM